MEQQEKKVRNDFKQVLDKVDVDLDRLKEVEILAIALKKTNVTDKELDLYIQRQIQLNKTNISIDMFIQLLDVVKVPIATDGGKNLLKKFTEFGSLDEAIIALCQ